MKCEFPQQDLSEVHKILKGLKAGEGGTGDYLLPDQRQAIEDKIVSDLTKFKDQNIAGMECFQYLVSPRTNFVKQNKRLESHRVMNLGPNHFCKIISNHLK